MLSSCSHGRLNSEYLWLLMSCSTAIYDHTFSAITTIGLFRLVERGKLLLLLCLDVREIFTELTVLLLEGLVYERVVKKTLLGLMMIIH